MSIQIQELKNSSAPGPQVLFYNMAQDIRTHRIEQYLTQTGVIVRHVQPLEFHEKLGYLLKLPGYEKQSVLSFGKGFQDEMLVMVGFTQERLDEFLRFFKREQIKRVELKAVLTPTNAAWDAIYLHEHMTQERNALAFQAAKRKRR